MKKIAIIGSTQYFKRICELRNRLNDVNTEIKIPAFEEHPDLDELKVCEYNRSIIEWADEIYVIWDQRSVGTIFDFGMVFMARKKLVIEYIEPKTFKGVMEKYAENNS